VVYYKHKTNHSEEDGEMAKKIRKGYLVKVQNCEDIYGIWGKNDIAVSEKHFCEKEWMEKVTFKSIKAVGNYINKRYQKAAAEGAVTLIEIQL
jgi:hypothetical protein